MYLLIIFLLNLGPVFGAQDCDDSPALVSGVDFSRAGNSDDPNADCDLRKTALFKLSQSTSPLADIYRAFEILKEQGYFSINAAKLSMPWLQNKSLPEEHRVFAAKVFYLLFYEINDPRRQKEVNQFLLQDDFIKLFTEILNSEPNQEIRIFLIQIFQVYLNPYREINWPRMLKQLSAGQRITVEKVVSRYALILLKALNKSFTEDTANDRNEILVALENLSATMAMQKESYLVWLKRWRRLEPDPSLRERLDDHPIYGPILRPLLPSSQ